MRRTIRPVILAAALAASALAAVGGTQAAAKAAPPPPSICPDAASATFGPNVCVFTPAMTQSAVQADLDAIATQQVPVDAQFNSNRYTIFFEPGTYGSTASPLVFQVGYYTQVAGLGKNPQDTVINGAADVFNNLCTPGTQFCNADDNFWRSLSNLTLNVTLPKTPPMPITTPHSSISCQTFVIASETSSADTTIKSADSVTLRRP